LLFITYYTKKTVDVFP